MDNMKGCTLMNLYSYCCSSWVYSNSIKNYHYHATRKLLVGRQWE